LKAYEHELGPYMKTHGYLSADVINVHKETPNIEAIRAKFLSEHTHSEDEVRFFVDGEGQFFFHLPERKEVFKLLCQKGDLISVPKGYTHWFDLAPRSHVKAIRVFLTQEGWVANYTNSGNEKRYSV
jgi:1,2-dihydroxy-3-keto-5-methylthiopentene dioxygenase